MARSIHTLTIRTDGKRLYEITGEVADFVASTGVGEGLLTLFCQHTSASLLINENAAPAVQRDLIRWLDKAVPEGPHYEHDSEGPDDMPAHIRTMLTSPFQLVPVENGRMMLGTWQGIFLAEHRAAPHSRNVVLHIVAT